MGLKIILREMEKPVRRQILLATDNIEKRPEEHYEVKSSTLTADLNVENPQSFIDDTVRRLEADGFRVIGTSFGRSQREVTMVALEAQSGKSYKDVKAVYEALTRVEP